MFGYIHPFISDKLSLIPEQVLIFLNIIIYLAFITDCIVSYTKIKNIDIKLKTIHEVGELLKEKIEELKTIKKEEKESSYEKLQDVIEELKKRQHRLSMKLYKQLYRFKKAFPTMQSEKVTDFLNQKIEIKKRIKEKTDQIRSMNKK